MSPTVKWPSSEIVGVDVGVEVLHGDGEVVLAHLAVEQLIEALVDA
jgi:hypothetical protein